jgi:hypothetical protein
MIMHIYHLVHDEYRPFSYLDFIRFEVNGQEYKMTHGTFRNNVSCLMKEGLVEVSCKSNITFYTLRGVKFDKFNRIAMTGNHTGVSSSSVSVSPLSTSASTSASAPFLSSNPLYRIIRNLPLNKNSVHDIHLRFASPQIYTIISSSITNKALGYDYTVNTRSKDILLKVWEINGLLIRVTTHRTDIVSLVIGCSLAPITLDISGVIRLTNALSIVEDRLSRIVEGSHADKNTIVTSGINSSDDWYRHGHGRIIPSYSQWIVTMWHFGADASVEYSGEKFSVTWEIAENVLIRAYSKVMNDNRTRIRLERQEYPRTTIADAIEQKINSNRGSGD